MSFPTATLSPAFMQASSMYPTWIYMPKDHLKIYLKSLTLAQLRAAVWTAHVKVPAPGSNNKAACIDSLVHDFEELSKIIQSTLTKITPADGTSLSVTLVSETFLQMDFHYTLPVGAHASTMTIVSQFFKERYGDHVFNIIMQPDLGVLGNHYQAPAGYAEEYVQHSLKRANVDTELSAIYIRFQALAKSDVKRICKMLIGHVPAGATERYCILLEHAWAIERSISTLSEQAMLSALLSASPFSVPSYSSLSTLKYAAVDAIIGLPVLSTATAPDVSSHTKAKVYNAKVKAQREEKRQAEHATRFDFEEAESSWPQPVSEETILNCMSNYREATCYTLPKVCAVCDRRVQYVQYHCVAIPSQEIDLALLQLPEDKKMWKPDFMFGNKYLDGIMLTSKGFVCEGEDITHINACHNCYSSLSGSKPSIPRLSWRNDLYCGVLPERFLDMTTVEQMLCAPFRAHVSVTRLYGANSDETQPRVYHGNTCAHQMNVISTAKALPRTTTDVNDQLSVVFVGPTKMKESDLARMLRVRKSVVVDFLSWARKNNTMYAELPVDQEALDSLPDDGILDGAAERVIHDQRKDPSNVFAKATAGPAQHPAQDALDGLKGQDAPDDPFVFVEKIGVTDPDSVNLSGRTFQAAALCNITLKDNDKPDLVVHRSSTMLSEYENPSLFPGLYPLLFPYGCGGFEAERPVPLSFEAQAEYFLDVSDRRFRYDDTFLFMMLNILNQRKAHLQTHMTVSRARFDLVAERLSGITADTIDSVAKHLENEGSLKDLSPEQQNVMDLLKHVNTITARIPGSNGAKLAIRSSIRSYFGYFGMPHIFLTLNPCAQHSPIFQVMWGDQSIDLSERYPSLAPSPERAKRLAQDPVAAADFFDFSVRTVFEHLFGWDYEAGMSSEEGGILGHLRAFNGTVESTNRGGLHGHFMLFLRGGLNPSDLHHKMKETPEFAAKFFRFWERTIYHHLPNIEGEIPENVEYRSQRPPVPPTMEELHGTDREQVRKKWEAEFQYDHKYLGEAYQRHVCRDVCHKYGNEGKCCFQFPHEVVETSHFDPATNSVFMQSLDPTVNYHSPELLVSSRHNHDMKNILSGKAAKAASQYISDYITKMDQKTDQAVSVMSQALAQVTEDDETSPVASAKRLLNKCATQFLRQNTTHSQECACYLRGLTDQISSHPHSIMLSGALMSHVKKTYAKPAADILHDDAAEETETTHIRLNRNKDGTFSDANQVLDYLFHPDDLKNMHYLDFSRCVRRVTIASQKNKHSHEECAGVMRRLPLNQEHPCHETHVLLVHTDDEQGIGRKEFVPKMIGAVPLRVHHPDYSLFCLAHFKPFSATAPLIEKGSDISSAMAAYQFDALAKRVMKNWEALHECEDEHDSERMRKRDALTAESKAINQALMDDAQELQQMAPGQLNALQLRDHKIGLYIDMLRQANWLTADISSTAPGLPENGDVPMLPDRPNAKWPENIKTQKSDIEKLRLSAINAAEQGLMGAAPDTEVNTQLGLNSSSEDPECPETEVMNEIQGVTLTHDELLASISERFGLNQMQHAAFEIISKNFISRRHDKSLTPLRLVLTGPGGTGKTYTVKAVQEVMKAFGAEHSIRFVAPTGSAASLIDGDTIHGALGVKIASKGRGKGHRNLGESKDDFSAIDVYVTNKTKLRQEWKNIEVLLIDEISLTGAELLSDVDHALRFAKERPDEVFGGVILICSGDFFQYPPVKATPLYQPIMNSTTSKQTEVSARLGCMAWKQMNAVVNLTEQQRMKTDPEYGQAVMRLRKRECTLADVELFNSRVIKSDMRPAGVDVLKNNGTDACVLVSDNWRRQALNNAKAHANSKALFKCEPVLCSAEDTWKSEDPLLQGKDREIAISLVNLELSTLVKSLPGSIPLYEGMPVILRNANIATSLKVANGTQCTITKIYSHIHKVTKLTHADCVIVHIPGCKAKFDDLPPECFPIFPVKWSFTSHILESRDMIKISRLQVPLQPAFSVTGHSAQGKTLPKVIIDLHEGGFAAYVGASRARSQQDVFITQPVKVEDLNKPLPPTLSFETSCLEAMAQNTLVKYGYIQGELLPVPDAESEKSLSQLTYHVRFNEEDKRKANVMEDASENQREQMENKSKGRQLSRKKSKTEPTTMHLAPAAPPAPAPAAAAPPAPPPAPPLSPFAPAGCTWNAEDWSCPYDSLIMSFYSVFVQASSEWQAEWRALDPQADSWSMCLTYLMESILAAGHDNNAVFNQASNTVHAKLHAQEPSTFPYGPVPAPVGHATYKSMYQPMASLMEMMDSQYCMNECMPSTQVSARALHNLVLPGYIPSLSQVHAHSHPGQHYDMPLRDVVHEWMTPPSSQASCSECNTELIHKRALMAAPPLLYFELSVGALDRSGTTLHSSVPSTLNIPVHSQVEDVRYTLRSIIYFGALHFNVRMLTDTSVWKCDGQVQQGQPIWEGNIDDIDLSFSGSKQAMVVLYVRQ
jgi:hypothetical protein